MTRAALVLAFLLLLPACDHVEEVEVTTWARGVVLSADTALIVAHPLWVGREVQFRAQDGELRQATVVEDRGNGVWVIQPQGSYEFRHGDCGTPVLAILYAGTDEEGK